MYRNLPPQRAEVPCIACCSMQPCAGGVVARHCSTGQGGRGAAHGTTCRHVMDPMRPAHRRSICVERSAAVCQPPSGAANEEEEQRTGCLQRRWTGVHGCMQSRFTHTLPPLKRSTAPSGMIETAPFCTPAAAFSSLLSSSCRHLPHPSLLAMPRAASTT